MTEQTSTFHKLNAINVNEYTEKKGTLTYLSWANAVSALLKACPEATWEIIRFNGLPYLNTELGYFVEVAVTINGITRSCMLPVLDNRNKPIPQPDSFQINTSQQRALTKAISLHGLGLYIYAGEDLPEVDNSKYASYAEAILKKLSDADLIAVGEIWTQLDREEQEKLWVAKTKGGYFTQAEKDAIRLGISEYTAANQEIKLVAKTANQEIKEELNS
jgi:hypothetical protein